MIKAPFPYEGYYSLAYVNGSYLTIYYDENCNEEYIEVNHSRSEALESLASAYGY